jgi:hypothetical protein
VIDIALPEGFYDLGESFWLRASMIGGGRMCSFLLCHGIYLTTEENQGKQSVAG